MRTPDLSVCRRMTGYLDNSPTPYHAVQSAVELLETAGFAELRADERMQSPGRGYSRNGGALVAWAVGDQHGPGNPVRVVGAHTDSPNLRVKPHPETGTSPWHQLGVEIYGGVLLNSWLDRDLGLAGRVVVREGSRLSTILVKDERPILRVPQLAIHLDREISEKGLLLNRQRHMAPIWATGSDTPDFSAYLAGRTDVDRDSIVSFDMMAFDLTAAALTGLEEQFLSSGRIDNLLSCFIGVEALVAAADKGGPSIPMLCLFDHEEVGSVSATGAASPLLGSVIDRINHALGGDLEDAHRARTSGLVVSADGAHATHPNYPERHEPDHHIHLNGGPVLKVNANQRYATDAATAAAFTVACEAVDVPVQQFVSRTDLACGSTIGPLTAGQLGIPVVDAGCAQLAMHSARETCGSHDPGWFLAALSDLLSS